MIQVVQVYILIMHEYNENLFKNIFVSFYMKSFFFWKVLEHINVKTKKAKVGVNLMCKRNVLLSCPSFLTICKCLIKPYLDYVDVIYDQPNLSSLANNIESV